MAELDAVKPRKCRNYFRTLVSIYTAAYKQDNFAVVDKVIKQFDEQIIMSRTEKASAFLPVFARLPDCDRQDDSPC